MLLTIDVGNTKTELGAWRRQALVLRLRVPTHGTEDLEGQVRTFLAEAVGLGAVEPLMGVALASVVPAAVERWAGVAAALGAPFRAFDGTNAPGVRVAVENPSGLGPDRVINTIGAMELVSLPLIAVDLGTATTFDVLDATLTFRGGAIAPGARTALDALVRGTARLPPIPLTAPPAAIGTDTVSAMQSGAVLGYASLVEGLIARIRAELGAPAAVVATGGLAATFAPLCPSFDTVDDALTLRGLRRAWELAT